MDELFPGGESPYLDTSCAIDAGDIETAVLKEQPLFPRRARFVHSPSRAAKTKPGPQAYREKHGIQVAEFNDLSPEIRGALLEQTSMLLSSEFGLEDHRYKSPESALSVLTERVRSDKPYDAMVVSHCGNQLIATASLARRDNPSFEHRRLTEKKYEDGWLVDVCTVKEHQKKGHAKRMVSEVLDIAGRRGYERVYLYAKAALAQYYGQSGFNIVGREYIPQTHDQGERQPVYVMRCHLLPAGKTSLTIPEGLRERELAWTSF